MSDPDFVLLYVSNPQPPRPAVPSWPSPPKTVPRSTAAMPPGAPGA